jgi:hypothetical protein
MQFRPTRSSSVAPSQSRALGTLVEQIRALGEIQATVDEADCLRARPCIRKTLVCKHLAIEGANL